MMVLIKRLIPLLIDLFAIIVCDGVWRKATNYHNKLMANVQQVLKEI